MCCLAAYFVGAAFIWYGPFTMLIAVNSYYTTSSTTCSTTSSATSSSHPTTTTTTTTTTDAAAAWRTILLGQLYLKRAFQDANTTLVALQLLHF